MTGERDIEAAARRGLEKQRRREQELKLANQDPSKDHQAISETTVMAQTSSTRTNNGTQVEKPDNAGSTSTSHAPYEP